MGPISVAVKGKGVYNLLRRGRDIGSRYSLTSARYNHALAHYVQTLEKYGCQPTFPITLVALQRHTRLVQHYQARGVEFAGHGYRHIDLSELSIGQQEDEISRCKQILDRVGIPARGFRSPYLRWNANTQSALRKFDFSYDSSQALAWPVKESYQMQSYQRVLAFYRALSAGDFPSLPTLADGLVSIPYSLPDDEAMVERLVLKTEGERISLWLDILQKSYERGEVFTLGLHPERYFPCERSLIAVLEEAHGLAPAVWISSLDEIADWWRRRCQAKIQITESSGRFHLTVHGPRECAVLIRSVDVDAPKAPWVNGYWQVYAFEMVIDAPVRPFIGLSPQTSLKLADFLWQQGYIIEINEDRKTNAIYFDRPNFSPANQRALLDEVEHSGCSLVRLARWPSAARSALAITGDIDALTYLDYGLRFLGR